MSKAKVKKDIQIDQPIKSDLKCDQCGKYKSDVVHTIDPYDKEINEREIDVDLCRDCYYERLLEI